MNILREGKRSKVFEGKCFQLNYKANRGMAGQLRNVDHTRLQPGRLATR
jgi:hypothetical protein